MSKQRFKLVPASYLYLVKEGKILLLRRCNSGFHDGDYSLVAGHLDGGETFVQAMVREAWEEAGIMIKPEDLEVVHAMHRIINDQERVDFFLKPSVWEGEPKIMEPDKSDDMAWFDLDNLPKNVIPFVRQAIQKIRNKKFYSEHGW